MTKRQKMLGVTEEFLADIECFLAKMKKRAVQSLTVLYPKHFYYNDTNGLDSVYVDTDSVKEIRDNGE